MPGEKDVVFPEGKNIAVMPDGVVVPTGQRGLSASEITGQIKDVVGRFYSGKDADKLGMTLLEAALYSAAKKAADGDLDALNKLLDRLMGKPIQQTIQATGTLREFLDRVSAEEAIDVPAQAPVSAEDL